MNEQKSLLTHLGEALDQHRARRRAAAPEQPPLGRTRRLRWLLPTSGNVVFTLLVVAGLFWATRAGWPIRTARPSPALTT